MPAVQTVHAESIVHALTHVVEPVEEEYFAHAFTACSLSYQTRLLVDSDNSISLYCIGPDVWSTTSTAYPYVSLDRSSVYDLNSALLLCPYEGDAMLIIRLVSQSNTAVSLSTLYPPLSR